MKHGDFTHLAQNYHNRPSYDIKLLNRLLDFMKINKSVEEIKVAEIGAGTGKLTNILLKLGFNVTAVEPNDAMRTEGKKYTADYQINWFKGSGEETGLPSSDFDWVIMASSFHWTNPLKSLPEFSRILKPGGFFTAMWNPRNLIEGTVFYDIEKMINSQMPNMERVSSGLKKQTKNWSEIISDSGVFGNVEYIESNFQEVMSHQRYMGIWRSVNDIRVQAGEKLFVEILEKINEMISDYEELHIDYKNTSWTAKKL